MASRDDSHRREIIDLEHAAWRALCTPEGADYYRELLAPNALMVFPFGTLSRQDALGAIAGADPWQEFAITDSTVARPSESLAAITYHATARREGQPEYAAWMTSVYVREEDGPWRMLVHQQSPDMPAP